MLAEQTLRGNTALGVRLAQLLIQERIVKANRRCVGSSVAEKDGATTRPVDCRETHRTGFATGVDVAAFELKAAQCGAGVADGGYFSMSGRVVGRGDAIDSGRKHSTIFDDDRAEWTAASAGDVLRRQRDRLLHKARFGRGCVVVG